MTAGALMVCGTSSDAGKTALVTGLCRVFARRGMRVAPFKAQNMALNSFVTANGDEIGRAQAAQAQAAGIEPHVDMNPILLKPTGERTSQVVVAGRAIGHFDAVGYHDLKPQLFATVLAALDRLRSRFDVIIIEGAGSPAEINLLAHDIVNLRVARAIDAPAILVGDIDRGGVFASLYGTVALLPPELRALVRGFVINKFRGDASLLDSGLDELQRRTGIPTLGVLPWIDGLDLDAEDSLALDARRSVPATGPCADPLDVAVVRFPRISNFTDMDALALEPGVSVRYVDHPAGLGDPDLVILPGTKATVADLEWLRGRGFPAALARCTTVLGICGGYQMLGASITDTVESERGEVGGLDLLPVRTAFAEHKTTRQRRGRAMGQHVAGYEIHHGLVSAPEGHGWVHLDDAHGNLSDGCVSPDGAVLGTTLHGLFECDGFRDVFLTEIGRRRGKTFVAAGVSFHAARQARFDRLADLVESHLDFATIDALLQTPAPASAPARA